MREHRVVVVGAGPAGLAATIALARAGIEVLLLERRDGGSDLPRATVLSLRSMELLRLWGLADRVRENADRVAMTMFVTPTLARAAEGTPVEVGYPSDAQSAMLSPTRAACVAQDRLDAVLREHVGSLPLVTLERGSEVVAVATSPGGATVTVRDASRALRTVGTEYVVAADGARSAVRTVLGIRSTGSVLVLEGARIGFRAPLWGVLGEHRHLLYAITQPDSRGVLLPAGGGDRWLFGVTFGPGGELATPPDLDGLRRRLRRAVDVPGLDVQVDRFDRFTSGAQLADAFSRDRVFLVGDAAHRVTPRGGTGLNIALADGVDLGWKLGWVLRGWALPALLDGYEAERRPVVSHHVERSADRSGARREVASEVQVDLGGRVRHAWVAPGVSTLDLAGDRLTLLAADEAAWRRAVVGLDVPAPVDVEPVGPLVARSLGLGTAGAVLLRPDAVPVATFSTPPAPGLLRLTTSAFLDGTRPPGAVGSETAA